MVGTISRRAQTVSLALACMTSLLWLAVVATTTMPPEAQPEAVNNVGGSYT